MPLLDGLGPRPQLQEDKCERQEVTEHQYQKEVGVAAGCQEDKPDKDRGESPEADNHDDPRRHILRVRPHSSRFPQPPTLRTEAVRPTMILLTV